MCCPSDPPTYHPGGNFMNFLASFHWLCLDKEWARLKSTPVPEGLWEVPFTSPSCPILKWCFDPLFNLQLRDIRVNSWWFDDFCYYLENNHIAGQSHWDSSVLLIKKWEYILPEWIFGDGGSVLFGGLSALCGLK